MKWAWLQNKIKTRILHDFITKNCLRNNEFCLCGLILVLQYGAGGGYLFQRTSWQGVRLLQSLVVNTMIELEPSTC